MRRTDTRTATVAAAAAVILTSLSLGPLFAVQSWFWPTALLVSAMAGAGYLARRTGLPALAVHSVQLLTLLVMSILLFVRETALAGVVPTPGSITTLADLLRAGLALADTSAPPVAADPAVTLLAAGGVGLVFLAVDLLAVTLRSPVAAGVPLLGLYAVAVLTLGEPISWPIFALAAAGWLALVLADGGRRLSDWGVEVGRDRVEAPRRPDGLASAGRRLGALAIVLAVVTPALLPTMSDGPSGWFGTGNGAGDGGDTVSTVNPYVDIQDSLTRSNDSEVLTYRTSDGDGTLLRLATLDVYLADIWQQSPLKWPSSQRATDGIPVSNGPAAIVTPFDISVSVGPLDENRLPLPYPTTRVTADGDWRYETTTNNVLSPEQRTAGLQYLAEALRVDLDPAATTDGGAGLPSDLERNLAFPQTTSRIVTQTALDVTAQAEGDFDKAVALQDWFRSEFSYDVGYEPGDGDPMVAFLNDRRGFCQQFASTMALMARSLGIPARVNVGFAQGSRNADGSWTVTWHDTHAWPELYINGAGWVAFEPTPRGGGGFEAPSYTATGTPAAPVVPELPADSLGAGHERLDPELTRGDPDALDPLAPASDGGAPTRWWLLLPAMLLLVVPAGLRWVRRRQRLHRSGDPEAAWAEWRDTWVDLGGEWAPGWTPRQAAVATGERLSDPAVQQLAALTSAVEEQRYSPHPDVTVPDIRPLMADARQRSGRWQRWRARLAPRSTWRSVARGAERSAVALDRTERSLAELTRRG